MTTSSVPVPSSSFLHQRVAKRFSCGIFFGTIVEEDNDDGLWHVHYDDDDEEDLNIKEVQRALRLYQSKQHDDVNVNPSLAIVESLETMLEKASKDVEMAVNDGNDGANDTTNTTTTATVNTAAKCDICSYGDGHTTLVLLLLWNPNVYQTHIPVLGLSCHWPFHSGAYP
jgi:hypothetical protein